MTEELGAMVRLARRLVASGTPGTLATLFSADGSTYRPLGSMMVSLPGMRAGGISGGCLEEYIARVGEQATRDTPAVMLRFDTHRDADDDAPVLGCGGSIELLVERLVPEHITLLEQCGEAAERDDGSWLACVVRREGESVAVTRRWLPSETKGPGTIGIALARTRDEATWRARSVHRILAPDTEVLVHYVPPMTRLVIFGAGDDAKPLCEIGASLGWHVSVCDRRARLATSARFPRARQVVAADWDEAIDAITFSSRTAVVMMTHNLTDDAQVLSLLPRPLAYVGALGPAHRRAWLLEEALTLMIDGDDEGLTLRGPIGLDLGDRSPQGIAVAVAAEILAQLNRRHARPLHAVTDVPAVVPARVACVAS
jgi:xanthine dehydrogenase accessory factor